MAISEAKVKGDAIGSQCLEFEPGHVKPGNYEFSVGTAGSATLVFQTILPALMIAEGPSQITLKGGTHNPWSPPFDFLQNAFLPLLGRMGIDVTAQLKRPGFYPAGGGEFCVDKGSHIPLLVYFVLVLYSLIALLMITAGVFSIRRWNKSTESRIPVPRIQLAFWILCLATAVFLVLLSNFYIAILCLLIAQFIPQTKKIKAAY